MKHNFPRAGGRLLRIYRVIYTNLDGSRVAQYEDSPIVAELLAAATGGSVSVVACGEETEGDGCHLLT